MKHCASLALALLRRGVGRCARPATRVSQQLYDVMIDPRFRILAVRRDSRDFRPTPPRETVATEMERRAHTGRASAVARTHADARAPPGARRPSRAGAPRPPGVPTREAVSGL
eukprot:285963-Prymnesium_polylepis.1